VFAAVDDVPWQFSEAEGKLIAEIKQGSDKNENSPEKEERATEFAKRLHNKILPEAACKSLESNHCLGGSGYSPTDGATDGRASE
jgi:hypothetical protein